MTADIPAQAVVAVATVIAAMITGVIALVNLTLSKEQKVSEMRQAWIDGLRDDLAKFLAAARFVANALHDKFDSEKGVRILHTTSEDRVADQRSEAAQAMYRIHLRLNPNEVDHQKLRRTLEQIVSTYNATRSSKHSDISGDVNAASDAALSIACLVLKKEWERVKTGEKGFKRLQLWLVPIITLVATMFVVGVFLLPLK